MALDGVTEVRSRILSAASLFFLYIFFFMISSSSSTVNSSGFANETDHQVLLAIKDRISEDPFGVLRSWNDSHHFCHWQGVKCSHRHHQRVTVLDLSSLQLVGSIAPHIGNLTFLNRIYLENNSFHGMIPQEVSRLFRLQYLSVSMNSLEGELPTNLTQCTRLRYIDVYINNLTGEIPTHLSSLPDLSDLILSNNRFIGVIPPSIGNLSFLSNLFLSRNNLQGNIPFELGKLSNLEFLQLAANNLSGMVPKSLYNISSLSYFSVGSNLLVGSLPADLGLNLPKLQNFLFGLNNFSGSIPSSIFNVSTLVQFDISDNAFTGPVPRNLGGLHDLELLYLNYNSLGNNRDNDLRFLSSLTNCTNLNDLDLAANHFGGELPDSIGNLSTKMISLILATNYITGNIPSGIGNLVNLIFLNLVENNLTGSIPDSIGKLSKLQEIGLYTNELSGEIPFSIGNLSALSILALEENMLEGRIPGSLGNCTHLQGLDLSYNHFSGEIPTQIFDLSSLSISLSLHANYLTGPLPFQVGNLKNIGGLDFSQNKLSGEIPSTLGNCPMLEQLYMFDNIFEGSIPSSFRQLKGITVINLSQNNLSGRIPSFLGELSSLKNLNLSFNMFEGEVPNGVVFRNLSAFSFVGNKKLCGGIKALELPECPTEIQKKERKHFPHRFIPLVIILSVVLLLVCLSVILYRLRSKQPIRNPPASTLKDQYPKVSYVDLREATHGFSSSNLIGEGKYGSVYKGILDSGELTVAVKVLDLQQLGANKSFIAECEALRNIRHRNLVKIITSCSSTDFNGNDFKALVFEFMPKGSLESWLHPQQDPKNLNLIQRLNIAIDVASALDYLHHHCETTIIHCDLKPSNILLDDGFCAHVGDFGLAKFLFTSNQTHSSSVGVRGTVGFIAPEYGMGEEVSTQGDVYSYGILILEMFTGKRPTDSMFTDDFSLHNYAKNALPDQVMSILDQQIILDEEDALNRTERSNESNIAKIVECLVSIIRIGVTCSVELPSERMDVRDVVMELQRIRSIILGGRHI